MKYTTLASLGVCLPRILLPRRGIDLAKWAVVACDQYTSEPEYWQEVDALTGSAPSALRLILPEAYLDGKHDEAALSAGVLQSMEDYQNNGVFAELGEGAVLVTRSVNGKIRTGLLLAFDLECYDYTPGSAPLIRPTEGTVTERVMARLALRKAATVELPHILMLLDDPECTVIEPLRAQPSRRVYNFELMQNGGHITGDYLPASSLAGLTEALAALAEKLDGREGQPLMLYAVGDGNHSLAAAKAAWEALKPTLPEAERQTHPARYALCELVNLHDPGIVFEPIHRVLFGAEEGFAEELRAILAEQNQGAEFRLLAEDSLGVLAPNCHALLCLQNGRRGVFLVNGPRQNLPVGTLQKALEAYLARHEGARLDYIHGTEALTKLSAAPNAAGFLLPPMEKEDLFTTVLTDGVLPKKTFSMGEANEKRYYLEARALRPRTFASY